MSHLEESELRRSWGTGSYDPVLLLFSFLLVPVVMLLIDDLINSIAEAMGKSLISEGHSADLQQKLINIDIEIKEL